MEELLRRMYNSTASLKRRHTRDMHIQGMRQPILVVPTQKQEVWSWFCKMCVNREEKKKARGMTKAELDFS